MIHDFSGIGRCSIIDIKAEGDIEICTNTNGPADLIWQKKTASVNKKDHWIPIWDLTFLVRVARLV